ncbi:unnamed protein product [Calicophoron daubneyi]|uniref:Cytochrome c oxidase subunit 4 n=1 Tax=Calicophoron daubneyi TaxID=300641 RepID=A0AAV2T5E7_CALDB
MNAVGGVLRRGGSVVCFNSVRRVTSVLTPLEKKYYPHIGNREIVGYGRNGTPMYLDDISYPYPGIRFRSHSDEIEALQKKEQGPWEALSIGEIKTLYRHSFRQTLAEVVAPRGHWKLGVGWGFMLISAGALFFLYVRLILVTPPKNVLELPEYKEAVKYKEVFGRGGSIRETLRFDLKEEKWRD